MKKVFNIAIIFSVLALLAGIYSRELPKFTSYEGPSALGTIHTHLFVLGALFPLLFGFWTTYSGKTIKDIGWSWVGYFIGVIVTIGLMLLRGTFEVLGTSLSRGADASISGIAGLGHAVLGISLIVLLFKLRSFVRAE